MKKILLGITGSIAAYKACELTSKFVQKGYEVKTIMTPGALKFITPLTFRALTGNEVYTDIFEHKNLHVQLGEWPEIILIVPATASFISKLANGIVSDLLTLTVISSQVKTLICPAMNENMYRNAIMQENIKKLKNAGYLFLGPYKGWFGCGHEGEGRLADIEDIVAKVEELVR